MFAVTVFVNMGCAYKQGCVYKQWLCLSTRLYDIRLLYQDTESEGGVVYVYIYMYMYVYIYIQREFRLGNTAREPGLGFSIYMYIHIVYIYMCRVKEVRGLRLLGLIGRST